jgi:glycosyltransferase involved in cell wall biosynthesis
MKWPKVSLVVPCFNEAAFIKGILLDIEQQDYPLELIELFIVDGRSTDSTRSIFEAVQPTLNYAAKLLDNPERIAPVAMNLGIEAATGKYIFIWGAHASYPIDFISKMIHLAETTEADCVGAICHTEPRASGAKAKAIAAVLSHPIGVGNASFRTGVNEVSEVDTVAFGCYPRKTFEKYGLFDPRLVRNQDIELNKRIVNQGGKILLDPNTTCTYYARSDFKSFWNNNMGNGEWVIRTAKITGQTEALSLRHFVPLGFALGFLLCMGSFIVNLLFEWVSWQRSLVVLVPIGLYFFIIGLVSLRIATKQKQIKLCLWTPLAFFVLHLSYGIGSIKGLLKRY